MDRDLKAFVECANNAQCAGQINSEVDPVKRKILLKLLEKEKVKQVNAAIIAISSAKPSR